MSHKKSDFEPPMRNGITASCVFLPKEHHAVTFLAFLCQQFPHIPPQEWQQRFIDGLVFNQMGQVLSADSPYQGNQHLYYYRHLAQEREVPFAHEIIFENEHLLVVDKPHFLTVSPGGQYVQQTLLTRLKQQFQLPHLTPIHRLDRETAGLIVFCKQKADRGIYQQLFAEKKIHKIYHAIAPYRPNYHFPLYFQAYMCKGTPFYTMQITHGIANSATWIELLQYQQNWAKYQLTPITGKQHQLRVHMNALHLPLRHDRFYPQVCHLPDDDFSRPLQLLAKYLSFQDPITQKMMEFVSPRELFLTDEMDKVLNNSQ